MASQEWQDLWAEDLAEWNKLDEAKRQEIMVSRMEIMQDETKRAAMMAEMHELFVAADANKDEKLDEAEFIAWQKSTFDWANKSMGTSWECTDEYAKKRFAAFGTDHVTEAQIGEMMKQRQAYMAEKMS